MCIRDRYGFDRFHLRRRCSSAAFAFWLDETLGFEGGPAPPRTAAGGERIDGGDDLRRLSIPPLLVRLHRPAELIVFGKRWNGAPGGLELGPGVRLHSF